MGRQYYWHLYRDAFPLLFPLVSSLLCWHLLASKFLSTLFGTLFTGVAVYKLAQWRGDRVKGIFAGLFCQLFAETKAGCRLVLTSNLIS